MEIDSLEYTNPKTLRYNKKEEKWKANVVKDGKPNTFPLSFQSCYWIAEWKNEPDRNRKRRGDRLGKYFTSMK